MERARSLGRLGESGDAGPAGAEEQAAAPVRDGQVLARVADADEHITEQERAEMEAVVASGSNVSAELAMLLVEIAHRVGVECIATNNVHYHERSRAYLAEVLAAVGGRRNLDEADGFRPATDERYLRSAAEMEAGSSPPKAPPKPASSSSSNSSGSTGPSRFGLGRDALKPFGVLGHDNDVLKRVIGPAEIHPL